MSGYDALRPLLFALPPESAHRLAVLALARSPLHPPRSDPRLHRKVFGLDFPNPIGLAAGFDKDGEASDGVLGLGFGFAEIGTVTPLPQPGNPSPRLFRLPQERALINRLGFNNSGAEILAERLAMRPRTGIVGINIGANRDSADRVADYVAGVSRFAAMASYLVLNVSSPNTSGLRDLQGKAALSDLLLRVKAARDAAVPAGRPTPLLVKIAPDLTDDDLADIAEVVLAAGIDGAILSNTTTSRAGLTNALAKEAGGLSGRPLFRLSTIKLARFRKRVGQAFPLIGVGGVDSGETAFAKLSAGADLVQLYTGFIYRGPSLPGEINHYLVTRMERAGLTSLDSVISSEVESWAAQEP